MAIYPRPYHGSARPGPEPEMPSNLLIDSRNPVLPISARKSQQLSPKSPANAWIDIDNLLLQGDYTQAILKCQRLSNSQTDSPFLTYRLALALEASGRVPEASELYRSTINHSQNSVHDMATVGWLRSRWKSSASPETRNAILTVWRQKSSRLDSTQDSILSAEGELMHLVAAVELETAVNQSNHLEDTPTPDLGRLARIHFPLPINQHVKWLQSLKQVVENSATETVDDRSPAELIDSQKSSSGQPRLVSLHPKDHSGPGPRSFPPNKVAEEHAPTDRWTQATDRNAIDPPEKIAIDALIAFPENGHAMETQYWLAGWLFSNRNFDRAARIYTELLRQPSLDPVHRFAMSLNQGKIYVGLGNWSAAIASWKHAADVAVNHDSTALAHLMLGQIYLIQNRLSEAVDSGIRAVDSARSRKLSIESAVFLSNCQLLNADQASAAERIEEGLRNWQSDDRLEVARVVSRKPNLWSTRQDNLAQAQSIGATLRLIKYQEGLNRSDVSWQPQLPLLVARSLNDRGLPSLAFRLLNRAAKLHPLQTWKARYEQEALRIFDSLPDKEPLEKPFQELFPNGIIQANDSPSRDVLKTMPAVGTTSRLSDSNPNLLPANIKSDAP